MRSVTAGCCPGPRSSPVRRRSRTGPRGQGHDDDIDRAGAEGPAHLRLLRPGYLRYAELPGFLGGALVAAYPSFGEGFGLPILEAMACQTPVLTTPRLSLPEVGGDAVAYTTEEPNPIAAGLLRGDRPGRLPDRPPGAGGDQGVVRRRPPDRRQRPFYRGAAPRHE